MQSPPHKTGKLDVLNSAGPRPGPTRTPSHRLPQTALLKGPHSRNDSHVSLQQPERPSPADKHQHLPRANPPTASFSGPRPSLIGAPALQHGKKKEDDFRADALWAEMQKTLADVELSAMNSSHVFSSTHAKALEELRTAQLGLAQAWAKSEADEMGDEEFGGSAPEASAVGSLKHGNFNGNGNSSPANHKPRSRAGSTNSTGSIGRNLEEETERDIRLARRRREANDRYFQQVNKGVLDVVGKLDEVANAMRRVEKESRDIWNDSSGSEDLGVETDTESVAVTDTDVLTESPKTPRTNKSRLVDSPAR